MNLGVSYSSQEITRLLDTLSFWLERHPNRNVTFVCGGFSYGYRSEIKIVEVGTNDGSLRAAPDENAVGLIRQICIGPLIGIQGKIRGDNELK